MISDSAAPTIDEDARRRFNAAWQIGRPEPIEKFLPPSDKPHYQATLEELVLIDLECWWQAHGQTDPQATEWHKPALVEGYLQRFPMLNEPGIILKLLREEFQARHQHGDCPGSDEYRRRFPALVVTGKEVETAVLPRIPVEKKLPPVCLRQPGQDTPPVPPLPTAGSGSPGHQLPERYQVLGEVARGGMGAILRGRDAELGRDIAIKVMLDSHRDEPELRRRFVEEARIGGQLQHPGIVPVYELGQSGPQQPYFTMKLVQGRTLAELLKERTPDDLPRFLSIFEQVCQTVAYAHASGVIHRDLKPANIMVGSFGEVQVMDWGLAKRIADWRLQIADLQKPNTEGSSENLQSAIRNLQSADTEPGSILGTPQYMAPEQARGEVEHLDERCDVFGLGALLCEVLTGQPPYLGTGAAIVVAQAMRAELAAVWDRLDGCGADAELIALAKRCLQPQRDLRPRQASEVADAVTSYLQSVQHRLRQTELARAEALVQVAEEQKRRRIERQKRRMTLVAAVLLLLLILGTSGAALWYQHEQARQAQEATQREAEDRRRQAELEAASALQQAAKLRKELHQKLASPLGTAELLSNLDRWKQLLDGAQQGLQQAKSRLSGLEEQVADEVQDQLAKLTQQLAVDWKDFELAAQLDDIHLRQFALTKEKSSMAKAAHQYAQVFTQRGLHPKQGDPNLIANKIKQSPLRYVLVAALEDWAHVSNDARMLPDLLKTIRLADPDPWRDEVRDLKNWPDQAKLQTLVESTDLARQSPHVILLLAMRPQLAVKKEEALRQALVHHPNDFWLNFYLGLYSQNPGEKTGSYRAALAVRPHSSVVYINLGANLAAIGDPDGALTCFKKAVVLAPSLGGAHYNLGVALYKKKDLDKAIDCLQKAVQFEPELGPAHTNLGDALRTKGDLEGAITCYHKALELDRNDFQAHFNLGMALVARQDLDGAIVSFKKALEIDRKHEPTLNSLIFFLKQQGQFAEAKEVTMQAMQVYPPGHKLHQSIYMGLLHCEHLLALDQKLSAILDGQVQPKDANEQLALAQLCQQFKKQYATAAKFYADAFADPKLAEVRPNRFDASRAAVLAAAGKGKDAGKLNAEDKAKLRKLALAWLQTDLALWQHQTTKDPAARPAAIEKLTQWQTDPDLASVRQAQELAKLPEAERQQWQQFWADVDKLLQQVKK